MTIARSSGHRGARATTRWFASRLSRTTSRHRRSSCGSTATPTTNASSICRRSAACAASPAQEKQESFVGSDLSYEDIGGRDIADYTYAFAAENATWTAPDGSRHPAWALESRAKDANAEFPRSVSLVLKDRFIVVHADIFNRRNERVKVFDVQRLERVDGIWTRARPGRGQRARQDAHGADDDRRSATTSG